MVLKRTNLASSVRDPTKRSSVRSGSLTASRVAFCAVTIVIAAMYIIPPPPPPQKFIRLGAVVSLGGRYLANGINTYAGYELAVAKINESGGVIVGGESYQFRIIYYDDGSNPDRTQSLAEYLIKTDDIKYFLGPYSSEMTAHVAKVTRSYRVPMVEGGGAARSLFEKGSKYIFGLLSTCEHYLRAAIALAVDEADRNGRSAEELNIAIAVQDDEFSMCIREAVLEEASDHNITVTIDDRFAFTEEDISDTLEKVYIEKPDILVISGHAKGAELATRLIDEKSIQVPFIFITHCEAGRIIENFGQLAEGFYCPAQWTEAQSYKDDLFGSAQEFAEALRKANPDAEYGDVPYQSAAAAAAVLVWKDAFERANSFDTEALRDAVATTDIETFYGPIRFAPTGEIISKPMILRQIRCGKFVDIKPNASRQDEC